MSEKPKPIVVSFSGRFTGKGAYTQYRIFSLSKCQEIKPHRTESSKSGNHWTDYWYLLPGKYFVAWQDISNTGKHRCGYGLLVVGSKFVQFDTGEIKFVSDVHSEAYGSIIVADGTEYHWSKIKAWSDGEYGIAEWVGDVPEFAKKALCECISPREYGY
jgi:hypothetical protein